MDGYQFVASILQSVVSIAWPAAVAFSVWLLRDKLASLMPLLRLKYKDFDISFRLDEAEKEAKSLPPPHETSKPTQEEADKFLKLAQISPSSAIADKSREVEESLATFSSAAGMKDHRMRGWLAWTRELRKHGLIDSVTAAVLDDLRAVRNIAVHGGRATLTEDDAIRFGTLADHLISTLQITAAAVDMNRQPAPLGPMT